MVLLAQALRGFATSSSRVGYNTIRAEFHVASLESRAESATLDSI